MNVATKIDKAFYSMCETISPLRKYAHLIRDKEVAPISTACVMDKNGRVVFGYSPKFVEDLSEFDLKFVLAHEFTHVLLRHLPRYADHVAKEKQTYRSCSLWNTVADAYINEFLLTRHFISDNMLESAVFFRDLAKMGITRDEFDNGTCESVYDKLEELDEQDEQDNSQDNSQNNSENNESDSQDSSNSGNSNGNSEVDDSSSNSENEGDDNSSNFETDEEPNDNAPINPYKQALDKQLDKAEEEQTYAHEYENVSENNACRNAECGDGYVSETGHIDHVEREFEAIKNATVNWEDKLRHFIDATGNLPTRVKSSKRVNKRYHDIHPHSKGMYKSSVKNLVVSIDVSGSMDAHRISLAVNAINELSTISGLEFDYYFFADTHSEVKHFTDMKAFQQDLQDIWSGGTSFVAATKYFTDNYEGAILISDMQFGYGYNVYKEVKHMPIKVQPINVDEIE